MVLTEILGRLNQLVGLIGTLLGITQMISVRLGSTAVEDPPFFIANTVTSIDGQLGDPDFGLPAIDSDLDLIIATMATNQTALLAAVALTQQAGSPVTLPTIPPTGYAAPTSTDNAFAVWSYILPSGGDAGDALSDVYFVATNLGDGVSFPGINADYQAAMSLTAFDQTQDNGFRGKGNIDPTTILPTDATIQAWLTRVYPTWGWTTTSLGFPGQLVYQDSVATDVYWKTTITPYQFAQFKVATVAAAGAPVWPGLTGVTLGTAVTLANGLVVTGPLEGVIVVITSAPYPISNYPFGTILSYVRAGAILFTDDNGDSEFPQPFGPNHQLILPKSMTKASSATVRLATGVLGTIQPFTIT